MTPVAICRNMEESWQNKSLFLPSWKRKSGLAEYEAGPSVQVLQISFRALLMAAFFKKKLSPCSLYPTSSEYFRFA